MRPYWSYLDVTFLFQPCHKISLCLNYLWLKELCYVFNDFVQLCAKVASQVERKHSPEVHLARGERGERRITWWFQWRKKKVSGRVHFVWHHLKAGCFCHFKKMRSIFFPPLKKTRVSASWCARPASMVRSSCPLPSAVQQLFSLVLGAQSCLGK